MREYAEAELISEVTLLHPMIRIIIIPHPNSAEREDALPMEDDLWRRSLGSSPHLEARARATVCKNAVSRRRRKNLWTKSKDALPSLQVPPSVYLPDNTRFRRNADGRPQMQPNAVARYSCALDVGLSGIQDLEGEGREGTRCR